jgi:hypothetical protein
MDMAKPRWTIIVIDKLTGKANSLFVGWGYESYRTERAALRAVAEFTKLDMEYGHDRPYTYAAYQVPGSGYESCAHGWYNQKHNLVDAA